MTRDHTPPYDLVSLFKLSNTSQALGSLSVDNRARLYEQEVS